MKIVRIILVILLILAVIVVAYWYVTTQNPIDRLPAH